MPDRRAKRPVADDLQDEDSPKADDPAKVKRPDIDNAVGFWERFAPPEYRGLITAKPVEMAAASDPDEPSTSA